MLKSLGLTILSLLPLSVCASDFDDVLNTIVGNSIAMKYGDADRQASISEMKADNALEAPEVSYENLWGEKGLVTSVTFRSRSLLIGPVFIWHAGRL